MLKGEGGGEGAVTHLRLLQNLKTNKYENNSVVCHIAGEMNKICLKILPILLTTISYLPIYITSNTYAIC